MKGRFLTPVQSSHCAGLLTGLVARLTHGGHQWTKQQADDLRIAYMALGHEMPFSFSPSEAAPITKPSMWERAKAKLARQA